jgi:DNA modification methylase
MKNERYYVQDAGKPFLAPESVDLFVTHPPYFNLHSEAYGNPEGQLQNTGDRGIFLDKLMEVIKHMEMALKPTGSMFIGLPTDPNFYQIIGRINKETSLQYGPMFFWDFTGSPNVIGTTGVENNVFLNLHKGRQQANESYKLNSYTLVHPWEIPDFLKAKSHIAFVYDSAPEIVYERIIQKYSKPGDVVADLMAGTGLVLRIAKRLGRETIYNDISESQAQVARMVIDDEKETPMQLRRKEVIDLMTKEVQNMNKQMMQDMNIPREQQEMYLKESLAELNRVNGVIFDMLVKNGVIR